MTPSAYIALARDIGIALALAFLVYKIYGAGENVVKINDIAALKTQLDDNSKTLAHWAQEASDAQAQRTQDMDKVTTAINAQHQPVFVRSGPPSRCTVSQTSSSSSSQPASPGGDDTGSRIDLRPQINRYELRVEALVADCRAALGSWPK